LRAVSRERTSRPRSTVRQERCLTWQVCITPAPLSWSSVKLRGLTPSQRRSCPPSTAVAFDGLGLLFANRSTATILAFGDYREGRGQGGLDAATKELGHCDPRHGSGASAGGCARAAWRSRWPKEEGQERAQTAAEAKGTRTPAGVEDADAPWSRSATGVEEQDGLSGIIHSFPHPERGTP